MARMAFEDFEPPQRLVRALAETRRPEGGDGVGEWLENLPELAQQALNLRELSVERVQAPGGRSSLVLLVRLIDGTPAVLKLAPERARPESERAALAHWDGRGAVRLLNPGDSHGVLLLERLRPDLSVRSLPEAKALLEAAATLRRLWIEPPEAHVFETVAERTGRQSEALRAGAEADSEVRGLVDAALGVRAELLDSAPEERLLHGTFRQSKVLAGERLPWLAVGPDPVVGECAFDLARLVRDRVEDLIASPSGAAITRRRVKKLAESLDVDQERLRGWTLFRAVESGVRARRVGRPRDAELLLEFAGWL
ncbi:aminoglycoside phosphotransferase family protein [Streptomyces caniscabiei]|uniref:Kinase n=1 Tax=Streptomyces caniscabiei TaxID=2746961 RepID=A0A927QQY0_9ACTN|nr:aminoglycoside phosphotransferase family protein [Streptomyces caniscabiei]MBD9704619.1 kinase [Streptomyces caniscabiei]MBD9729044.1 kinase [Streptomyces caniscabiei]MDX3514707.1 aminoglycoside phosphotransferase family protein [Streptomyces caniscabiei]MDX3723983.1 aminoglycoside phosphotransferase family protein [Streptomyces caniscabiei]MDX3731607.1 aminoglycoside phosphotransferase family protein [Streptomyces caniscabiei]